VQAKHARGYTRVILVTVRALAMAFLIRVLLLAGIGWLLYRAYIRWQTTQNQHRGAPPPEKFEPMSRCTGCGLYLPSQSLSPSQRCGSCEQKR